MDDVLNIKKIKILFFCNSPVNMSYISGTGNWVVALLEQLVKFDSLEIFAAYHDNKTKNLTSEVNSKLTIYRIPTKSGHTILARIIDNLLVSDIYMGSDTYYKKIINSVSPDIIQIFGMESPFIKILNFKNDNVVVHIQGLLASCYYKYYPRFSNFEILRTISLKQWLKGSIITHDIVYRDRHLRLERSIYTKIKYVLGRTDWDRHCLRAIAPQARYFYCQELMRAPFFHVEWKPVERKKKILYTTIRDNWIKNVDMIYETTKILSLYNPSFAFEWRVAGVANADITPKIYKNRNLLTPQIKLLGMIPTAEIIKEIMGADLFIYPSAIENSSNAVQEAMLCGIPILCTFVGGLSTIISNNETGILVPEGDPYVLAGTILEIFDNYSHAIRLGFAAKNVAMDRNKPTQVIAELMSAYNEILGKEINLNLKR